MFFQKLSPFFPSVDKQNRRWTWIVGVAALGVSLCPRVDAYSHWLYDNYVQGCKVADKVFGILVAAEFGSWAGPRPVPKDKLAAEHFCTYLGGVTLSPLAYDSDQFFKAHGKDVKILAVSQNDYI